MFQLLLLGVGHAGEEKKYLYVLEMGKRKILRIVKFDKEGKLYETWKKGMITVVDKISSWDREDGTYTTYNDRLIPGGPQYSVRILLNMATYPEHVICCTTKERYGLVRLSSIDEIEEKMILAKVWAWKDSSIRFDIQSEVWNNYWTNHFFPENQVRFKNLFSSQKRKIFAIIKTEKEYPLILDFMVL